MVPQREHLVLQADEVDVLVVKLVYLANKTLFSLAEDAKVTNVKSHLCDGICLNSRRRQILQPLPRDGRDEVEVVRPVERRPQVLRDPLQVLVGRLAEVDGGNVGNRVSRGSGI